MKLLKWVAVALALVAVVVWYFRPLIPGSGDFTDPQRLTQALKEANYCSAASECERVSFGCPWGNQLINRAEVSRITSLERHYRGDRCVFEYSGNPGDKNPMCVENRCQPGPWPGQPPKLAPKRMN